MKELKTWQNIVLMAGAVLLLVGAFSYWFLGRPAAYIYIVGVLLFAFMQVQQRYTGQNPTIRRLRKIQLYGAASLVLTGILLLVNNSYYMGIYFRNEWMVTLAIGAFMEFYTAFRIPDELEKEKHH